MNYFIYRHIRLDKNEPFYIGWGKIKNNTYPRAYSKHGRNPFWKNIVSKTDYAVEILYECIEFEEILKKEIELIALYGRDDLGLGPLCNLTDGGEGCINAFISDERRAKFPLARKGKKHALEAKNKVSEALRNRSPDVYKQSAQSNYKPVVCLDREFEFITEYKSILCASENLNLAKNTVSSYLHNDTTKFLKGKYIIVFKEDYEDGSYLLNKERYKSNKGRKLLCKDILTGEEKIFDSISEYCREVNASQGKIRYRIRERIIKENKLLTVL